MRYAKFLPDQGTIGFIAPSFGCNTEPYYTAFQNAMKTWKGKDYELKCGPNVYEGSGLGISNAPNLCAKEFNDWYLSEDTDVLISCGGGELMCDILDYVDFEAVRQGEPKWFMGYSDNTNLTFLLTTLCDTASIYGPCAPAFGMRTWHPCLEDAMKLLTGKSRTVHGYDGWEKESLKTEDNPLQPYNITEPRKLRCYPDQDCRFKGRLVGGCLDILVNLCGTRFDQVEAFLERYKEDGFIWFMEACDLNPICIRRALWVLSHAGWFRYVKGFLIGRPYCFGEEFMGIDQYSAVTDMLAEYNVPIIMDVDLGHLPPMMPLVCGSLGHVNVQGNEIEIEMEYV